MAGKVTFTGVLLVGILFLLCSCGLHYPSVDLKGDEYPELTGTPFFPQKKYQCGPAALAALLVDSGVDIDPDELLPYVYVPEKKGSLQVELLAAARTFGRIAYVLDPNINALVEELLAGRPVLVLQNYGLKSLPSYHFAVVIGFLSGDTVVLRSGTSKRLEMKIGKFLMSWVRSGSWAMVVLQPGEMPENVELNRYVEAVAAFEDVAGPDVAFPAYESACECYPDETLLLFALGNNRLERGLVDRAIDAFQKVLELDPGHIGAANNLADTLAKKGCFVQALGVIDELETNLGESEENNIFLETLRGTRTEIEALVGKEQHSEKGGVCR